MDNNKSYIGLKDSSTSESMGNGPRSTGIAIPMPPLPSQRKNTTLIVVIVVASFLVLLSVISVMVLGFTFIRFATGQAQQVQTVFIEEALAFPHMEVWGREFGEHMEAWALEFGNDIEFWAEDFALYITDWAEDWTETWTTEVWVTDTNWIQGWTFFDEFRASADFVDGVYIALGTSNVRILPHNDVNVILNGGGWIFQVHHDVENGIVSVTDNHASPGGTLILLVPHNWAGYIDFQTQGDVYISDSLTSDVILNQRFMFVH